MGKKSNAAATSKISASSALTSTSTSASSNRSSLLKSYFAPSYLQLHLFATVIQSFDSQQLRIHDTSNGRLRQQHNASAGTNITCLDWGYYGPSYREYRASSKKKRKRTHDNHEDVVVAYGTSNSEICFYSPAEGSIVGSLKGGHDREIRDFKFLRENNLEAWSIGSDSKLVQWNLQTDSAIRTISLPDSSIRTLAAPTKISPQILCASVSPYTLDFKSKDDSHVESYDAFKYPVHSLLRSSSLPDAAEPSFLAADEDRYINLYSITDRKILRTLVAGGSVSSVEQHEPVSTEDSMLAVVTKEGYLELFAKPYAAPQSLNGDMKAKRKNMTRKANAIIKLVTPDGSKKHVPIFSAVFDGPNLVIVSVQGGVDPVFQKLRWQDEGSGELLFEGTKEVPQAKLASTLNSAQVNGVKDMGLTRVNDSKTVVVNGGAEPGSQVAPVEIGSSGEESADDSEADASEDNDSADDSDEDNDAEMADADDGLKAEPEDEGEPSFGDLLAARHPEVISVDGGLPTDQNALVSIPESNQVMLPSGMSLGTVLTQSLRTNDQSLLETCLHVTDQNVIQNTLLRLDSSLAANLLTKLAERLADRPGRYGHLLTWVQCTMIAHGGAIASQAAVASKLRTLYQVLNERSRILPSILLLKGKLDMMSAQQSFRAQSEAHRSGLQATSATLYIEGEADNWSSSEDEIDDKALSSKPKKGKRTKKDLSDLVQDSQSSDGEDMPMTNGDLDSDSENAASDEDPYQGRRINGIVDAEAEAEVSGESENEDDDVTGSEGSEEEDDDEDASSLEDFINDGEISVDEDEDDVDIDNEPERPSKKRSKH